MYVNFNESLTNDVVSFEQLGPDVYCSTPRNKLCITAEVDLGFLLQGVCCGMGAWGCGNT